jgi:hypothetical protein
MTIINRDSFPDRILVLEHKAPKEKAMVNGTQKISYPPTASLPSFPGSVRQFAGKIRVNGGLCGAVSRRPEFKAAYLVVNHQFYFSERGHMDIINQVGAETIERNQPSHYGWFKMMPHPQRKKMTLFVFDSFSDYNQGKAPDKRWNLSSIDEYFSFFYLALLKSGIPRFCVRFACVGKRAVGLNKNNWRSASMALFESEEHEKVFLAQLARLISPDRPPSRPTNPVRGYLGQGK